MELTRGQEAALQAIRDLQRSHPDGGGVAVIAGYAGTGKTTTLSIVADEYDDVFALTPTGKAALRVKEAAGCDAMTVHRWMYKPQENPETGEVSFVLKEVGEVRYPASGLLVVDEASMLGFDLFRDLYRYARTLGLNLVLVGDNFQLPPVEPQPDRQAFSVFAPEFPADHRVQLTEVVRQALDSPIIRASMAIRTDRFYLDALRDIPQVRQEDLDGAARRTWERGGVVICHKNATRHGINAGVRKQLGRQRVLEDGEPLLVLQNNYDLDSYNGEVVDVLAEPQVLNVAPMAVMDRYRNASMYMDFLRVAVRTAAGEREAVVADREVSGENGDVRSYAIRRTARVLIRSLDGNFGADDGRPRLPVLHANWGYSLTCHKAQGSEFPAVLGVIEPSARVHTDEGRRWLYTMVTRAKKELQLCWT